VFEIEVFGHEGVQSQNVKQMVYMVPLRSALLVEFFLLYAGGYGLGICFYEGVQGFIGGLDPFLVAVELESYDDMLFEQEVL